MSRSHTIMLGETACIFATRVVRPLNLPKNSVSTPFLKAGDAPVASLVLRVLGDQAGQHLVCPLYHIYKNRDNLNEILVLYYRES